MRRIDLLFGMLLVVVAALAIHLFNPRRRLVENDDSRLISLALTDLKQKHAATAPVDALAIVPAYPSGRVSSDAILDAAIRSFSRRSLFQSVENLRDLKIMHPEASPANRRLLEPLDKLDLPPFVAFWQGEKKPLASRTPSLIEKLKAGTLRVQGNVTVYPPGYTSDGEVAVLMLETSEPVRSRTIYVFEHRNETWTLLNVTPHPASTF